MQTGGACNCLPSRWQQQQSKSEELGQAAVLGDLGTHRGALKGQLQCCACCKRCSVRYPRVR